MILIEKRLYGNPHFKSWWKSTCKSTPRVFQTRISLILIPRVLIQLGHKLPCSWKNYHIKEGPKATETVQSELVSLQCVVHLTVQPLVALYELPLRTCDIWQHRRPLRVIFQCVKGVIQFDRTTHQKNLGESAFLVRHVLLMNQTEKYSEPKFPHDSSRLIRTLLLVPVIVSPPKWASPFVPGPNHFRQFYFYASLTPYLHKIAPKTISSRFFTYFQIVQYLLKRQCRHTYSGITVVRLAVKQNRTQTIPSSGAKNRTQTVCPPSKTAVF